MSSKYPTKDWNRVERRVAVSNDPLVSTVIDRLTKAADGLEGARFTGGPHWGTLVYGYVRKTDEEKAAEAQAAEKEKQRIEAARRRDAEERARRLAAQKIEEKKRAKQEADMLAQLLRDAGYEVTKKGRSK